MDHDVKRLAIPTENHSIEYADFEGIIPEDQYGVGTVIVWDKGYYQNIKEDKSFEESFKDGHNTIKIHGYKLKGNLH